MENIDVRMVVIGMDVHKIPSIEDSGVMKQGVICDDRRIPCYEYDILVKGSYAGL